MTILYTYNLILPCLFLLSFEFLARNENSFLALYLNFLTKFKLVFP